MDHSKKVARQTHPQDTNNIISNIFFVYAINLFKKGSKKDLLSDDLYEVRLDYRSKKLGDRLEREWDRQKKDRGKLSIIRLLLHCYGPTYLVYGLMQLFINVTVIVVQPYTLGKVISYFSPGQTDLTKADAYIYAAIVIGLNLFQCVYKHNCYLLIIGFAIKVRTAICSFLYRKSLKLNPDNLPNMSVGNIVTLITRDVLSLEYFVDFGNDIWIGVVKTLVISGILWYRIGVAALTGVGFFLAMMPIQIYIGTRVTALKMESCKKTDERLQATQETLSAIRIIKMYTWENIFNDRISNARKKEVYTMYKLYIYRFLILIIGSLNGYIAFYLMLMTYISQGNNVTAELLYFILTTFQSLSYSLGILFPIGIYQAAELKSAMKRIGYILKACEVDGQQYSKQITILPKISMKNVTVFIKRKQVLEELSLNAEKGLTLLTGSVGCGKTVFLKTLLGDYETKDGSVTIQGNISYASQQPWLFPSSIKQNILFGQEFDEKRYHEVLKVCALVYDFELLEAGDATIVEDRGINLSKGQQARINLARAIYRDCEIYLLDDPLAALDAHVGEFIFKECIQKFLREKLVVLVTHNSSYTKQADQIIVLKNGKVQFNGKTSECNEEVFKEENKFDETRTMHNYYEYDNADEETGLITENTVERKVYHEEKKEGDVDKNVYKKYITFGGGYGALFMVFCIYVLAQWSSSYTDKMLSEWVNLEEKIFNYTGPNSTNITVADELFQQRHKMSILYTVMTTTTIVTVLSRAVSMLLFSRRASINLHKSMITSTITASMEFFDRNFIGNILNRFSKDLTSLDENIPFVIYNVFRIALVLTGIITLIASVNAMFLIPTAIFLLISVVLRRYYLRTGRSLKRLDALTRSPVVGYLNATLEGLTTIRACKTQEILRNEFDRHQDLYTSATYSFVSSMRAFAFVLDTICGFYIGFIVLRFLVIEDGTSSGDVGLAISQAFMMTGTLQWGIRQWAELENQMTSVERVLEYTELKQENQQGLEPEGWPTEGEIKYDKVNLSYTNSTECVLKNITFTVQPKEKIGIVGRTGAGKSSIISTLFRLYDVEGRITIDGADIKTLSLDVVRSNISIIPQDPVLFTGNIRDNIDPTRRHTDEEIWKAIELSHLKKLVSNLDAEITEGGSNFSVGQRQLICLARAIILRNKIIVLDEATANMDQETDALIHRTINENFVSCTVFTIAHKMHSILHSDKVMALDKGEIVEYDKPANLLQNKNGIFYKMVAKSGLLSSSK